MASGNIKMLQRTGNNEQSDECYTPAEGIEPLLEFLPKDLTYYECTSGKSSSIVSYMCLKGYNVLASYTNNFLTDDIPQSTDAIITNPPYSKKDQFIKRCYDLKKPFALLLPVTSIQGKTRGRMFTDLGIEILVLNERIDFTGKGNPHFGVAWFCKDILPRELIFK